jgi:hypothetical protein
VHVRSATSPFLLTRTLILFLSIMPLDSYIPKRTSKSRQYNQFIRGPLPLKWFQKASNISRTAGVVGLIIWGIAYQRKLWGYDSQRRTSGHIKVTNQTCKKWGVCGNSKNTALRLMEKAGLIRLDLKRGRSPLVQIVDDELRGPVT